MVQAENLYPAHPEHDESYFHAEFSPASQILSQGCMYLELAGYFPHRQYEQQAWDAFAQINQGDTKALAPTRSLIEIVNHQADAALALGNLELFGTFIQRGIEGAQALQSKQRYQEAVEVYQKALTVWPHERSLHSLSDVFQHS